MNALCLFIVKAIPFKEQLEHGCFQLANCTNLWSYCICNILVQYKYPDGSIEERNALNNSPSTLPNVEPEIEFTVLDAEYEFGQDVLLQIRIHNIGGQERNIRGKITCQAVTYTER